MRKASFRREHYMADCKEVTRLAASRGVDHVAGDTIQVKFARLREYATSGRNVEVELVMNLTVPEARELALALYPELAIYEQIVRQGLPEVAVPPMCATVKAHTPSN